MAESPGKLLSYICLGAAEQSRQSGCVNVFLQLFDWNRRLSKKGLFSKRLLPPTPMEETAPEKSQRKQKRKKKRKNMTDDHLPMAKFLLIADENRRSKRSSSLPRLAGTENVQSSSEMKSLQELLHVDQEDSPKMLHEFLFNNKQEQKQQQPALLNLLMQEVNSTCNLENKNQSATKSQNAAGRIPVPGCGGAFGKKTSGLFLEAAAKILDRKSRSSRRLTKSLSTGSPANKAPDARAAEGPRKVLSPTRRTASAPCSPVSGSHDSSCTSIGSLMDLFLDDLEEGLKTGSLRRTVSEPCSPTSSRVTHMKSTPVVSSSPETPPRRKVDELDETDYVSFRDFLTGGKGSRSKPEVGNHGFMVHNPLFEDNTSYSELEDEEEEEDEGLEDILKSILYQTTKQQETSRLTWLPHSSSSLSRDSYLYNKDNISCCSNDTEECHQVDNDSVEVTSESNCGEDCGQPSPISVLDSPFDDELRRKSKQSQSNVRRRLSFTDEVATTTTTTSSCFTSFQRFDLDTLKEAEEYILMILEESGVSYHADITLLKLAENDKGGKGIISNSVFERLEDRMRVQQLISHLEACGSSSRTSHHSLESLRAHYESYHESRSRRRMVFDFANEVLENIVGEFAKGQTLLGERVKGRVMSGRELVDEANKRVVAWKREAFENVYEVVEREINRSACNAWRDCGVEGFEVGMYCEENILRDLLEELASDLLAV